MFLAIDIGNTHTTLGLMKGQDVLREYRVTTRRDATSDEIQILVRQLEGIDRIAPDEWDGAAVCSVVPSVDRAWMAALGRLMRAQPLLLSPLMPMPVRNVYNPPGDVGMDRLANAVAAFAKYGAPFIIVDLGTATTLDVVTKEGDYIGGVILAGLQTTAEALFQRAAKLPLVNIEPPTSAIGRSTVAAMQAGLFHGCIDAIEGSIRRIEKELGYSCQIIATGGLANVLGRAMERLDAVEPMLTLHGIEALWRQDRQPSSA
jgi:type III pantothenate kinase